MKPEPSTKGGITRTEFISKASLIAVAVPMATFSFGIASGAHNYRLRRRTIRLPNLPKEFDGITIGQLSDIHSGSFFSRKGVKKGIDLLKSENPDVIFFTGDLVNDVASEVKDYKDLFAKVKAPLEYILLLATMITVITEAGPVWKRKRIISQHSFNPIRKWAGTYSSMKTGH
jgi:hypothetical protein